MYLELKVNNNLKMSFAELDSTKLFFWWVGKLITSIGVAILADKRQVALASLA